MRIASVGTAFPVHRYPQAVITEALKDRMQDKLGNSGVMNRLHSNCGVDYRHIMFPLDTLGTLSGFGPTNDLWIKGALELGQQAIQKALDQVGLTPSRYLSHLLYICHGHCLPKHRCSPRQPHGISQERQTHSDLRTRLRCRGRRYLPRDRLRTRLSQAICASALRGALLADLAGGRLFHGQSCRLRTLRRRRRGGRSGWGRNTDCPTAHER